MTDIVREYRTYHPETGREVRVRVTFNTVMYEASDFERVANVHLPRIALDAVRRRTLPVLNG